MEIAKQSSFTVIIQRKDPLNQQRGRSKIFLFVLTTPTNGLFVSIETRSSPIDHNKNQTRLGNLTHWKRCTGRANAMDGAVDTWTDHLIKTRDPLISFQRPLVVKFHLSNIQRKSTRKSIRWSEMVEIEVEGGNRAAAPNGPMTYASTHRETSPPSPYSFTISNVRIVAKVLDGQRWLRSKLREGAGQRPQMGR